VSKYLGNASPSKKEVHDLDNENTNCQIDEIIRAGSDGTYNCLSSAQAAGLDNCYNCIGASKR
jgi:hypothetical protein